MLGCNAMADSMMPGQRTTMNPNLWWFIAAGGIGLVLVATLIAFFNGFGEPPMADEDKAPAIFMLLGYLAFVGALALMAALQTAWSFGARAAMLLGAGFFALTTGGALGRFI